jgi:hypothetical protein
MSQTTYHFHRHQLDLSSLIPKKWVLRALLLSTIVVPQVNAYFDDLLHPNYPYGGSYDGVNAIATEAEPFDAMAVYTPHFYDTTGQTAQSYDFTLVDPVTDSEYVPVPSPCPAVVIGVNHTGAMGYGNHVEFECTDTGHIWFMGHFDSVDVAPGEAIRKGKSLGIQGSTGNSTGPHVHAEIDVTGDYITDTFDQTEPVMEQAIAFWESGVSPVAPLASAAGSALDDETLKCAIGNAEGTMHDDCSKNPAYFGHVDPGNGADNLGAFSYQHGASTPGEADAKQLQRLRTAEKDIQQRAVDKFGQPLSKAALASALDLWNQAPLAGNDFVDHLTTADPSPQQIIDARAASFIDPASGALDAPGLGNSMNRVQSDQQRRTDEVLEQLK